MLKFKISMLNTNIKVQIKKRFNKRKRKFQLLYLKRNKFRKKLVFMIKIFTMTAAINMMAVILIVINDETELLKI